ncbi:MAG: kinase/pyrophosphorylase [Proteobacteria bacterium]|nr:kinase/pyrophosphorylase [Pseudomonadota bacterium]NDC24436.1 kinase/pyrophosphorylase [Pseudomonadota bacterium]NDD04312.1 kinase/pyrophosphorylase [Pseudomonadota bacterium]NDG28277.1 kinase/pyrophosphorylase [Pseudomonadota bacterium]
MNEPKLTLFIMSDGTGETADLMIKAALVQYSGSDLKIVRYKNVRTEPQVTAIFEEAHSKRGIVVYTIVAKALREFVEKTAQRCVVPAVDLLGPLLQLLSQFLTQNQKGEPGLFHQVNESYFKRIEAIEFTVKHDDGRFPDNLEMADIILVGLSRTSKTPLSIYLSYKGWKVANVPVVRGIPLPEKLFLTDQRKIVGLIIDSKALVRIRRERLLKMGEDPHSSYADPAQVELEIDYCKDIFRKNRRWPVFDVTNKALEETAAEIEKFVCSSIPEKFLS